MKAELEGDDMYSKVLVYIQQNPGCHLRRIKNEIGMSMGSVQYQLFRLEKRGRRTCIRRGLYKFYYFLVLNADFLYIIIEEHVPKQQYHYFLLYQPVYNWIENCTTSKKRKGRCVLYSVYFSHPIPFKKNNGIKPVVAEVEKEEEGEIRLHDDSDNENHHHINISDNRSRVYEYIKNKPGSNLRKISKELVIAMEAIFSVGLV
jgi:hypothetical protein